MLASMEIRKYLLSLAVCLLLIGTGSVFGASEDGLVTYPFRIVQMSDTQPLPGDEVQWKRVPESVELANSLKPDFVIFPGDITYSGTEDEYKRMKELLSKIEAPVYYVPGNHDTLFPAGEAEIALYHESLDKLRDEKLKLYHKYFGPDHWSFEYGDFLFVGFDGTENRPRLSRSTREFLAETFAKSDKPYKFIVTHYHPHEIDGNSAILEQLLTTGGVMGRMHGHNHGIYVYKSENTGRLVFCSNQAACNPGHGVTIHSFTGISFGYGVAA